jgi:putative sigma-54 modulation protein
MQIEFSFRHMDSSEALRTHATQQSERLKKYFDGRIHIRWAFVVEHGGDHIAHCHVTGSHMDYFAEATTPVMQTSVDECIDRIARQVQKKKEIVKNRLHAERVLPST